jgi:ribonucleoside-diphosphate reductase alpha chain
MKIARKFTNQGQDPFSSVKYEKRTSRISNPDGSVVFEMTDAEIPEQWSQLATDIMVSKYFRKAGVPQVDSATGLPLRDHQGNVITGPEKSAKQVIHRLAGCWRYWGEKYGYFDSAQDAQAFYDELVHMLLHQMAAPNSPQWFNTGLNFAYGITGPAQGHYYNDPRTGETLKSRDAYTHSQPHACFIQSVQDDLVNEGGIMDLWVREARLFKYGSGTGSNFSKLRGENEKLSGGGKSSGLMSFLRIGDRAAGAIKSGGTTRRAAKMVCLDLDHPDVEQFINWKVREELKVAAMVEGLKVLPKEQQDVAKRLGLRLDYDFNGEAYYTVSGQNSNNSIRIPNKFFKSLEEDGDWNLTFRNNGKIAKSLKARDLWDQIAFAAWRCADPGVQYDDTINQWHTCPRSGRINASNPCVTGDTRVLTPGGIWRRIDQMIHLPARLVTNLDKQEIHTTEGAFPTGTREVFELKTAGGYKVTLTADHKVFTRQCGWVEAKNLNTNDEIKLPSRPAAVHEIGEPQDPRLFQLLGLFLSTANGPHDAVRLDQVLSDSTQIDAFAQYAHDNWGAGLYNDDYANAAMIETDSSEPATGNSQLATQALTNRRLLSRLSAFIRTDSHGRRRLGDEAFTAGLAAQKHFLRGLFTADANIDPDALVLHADNKEFLEDVQLILLGFGVKSSIFSLTADNWQLATLLDTRGALPERRNMDRQVPIPGEASSNHEGGAIADEPRIADTQRHGLRIDSGSLRNFAKHIALLPGPKLAALASLIARISQDSGIRTQDSNWDHVHSLTPLGKRQVFDLTEPVTDSFIANGLTVHNCSEYMFLDDTACNLASLNVLTFFDSESRRFHVEDYKHAIRIWTIVLEISVLMASFPSESIARLSYKFRTLGLGYANLGAMLMQAGISYDSDKARAICAALTAILTGESYATSAELAEELGAFPGYDENKQDMLRVIRNHRRAAYAPFAPSPGTPGEGRGEGSRQAHSNIGYYEQLDIPPVPIDSSQFASQDPLASDHLLHAAQECWDRALKLGEKHGYRNAQTTVIAPTGTIGLLMDCDTTGVEPDFALVKFKKLAGGGYFKIANQSLRPALVNLGYAPAEINDILKYVLGSLTFHDAPHINTNSLRAAGFTDHEIHRIEESLPAVFELGFAFSPWSVGAATLQRLGVAESEWQKPGFNLLARLGFSRKQIAEANDHICGRGTVEGAPHLKDEHLCVFDCANKCGKTGQRFIPVEGHIKMMAAAQPFISGAISKTINLPNEATVEDIKNSYELSWKLGLKANALYRDGSKLSQPLNVKSDEELEKEHDEQDEDAIQDAREEVAAQVASVASFASGSELKSDNLEAVPTHTNIIEKIVERIVERPLRRRLPDTRNALTHKFDVAGHEGYITVGLYEDGSPGEVFITMAKEGSTIGGLMDTIATLVSVALQYGVPVESLVRKFEHVRFEPSGMTRNPEIPFAKSLVDYIFRYLAMQFIPAYRAANAPRRPDARKPQPQDSSSAPDQREGEAPSEPGSDLPIPRPQPKHKDGNGHGPRIQPDTAQSFEYDSDPDHLKEKHSPKFQAPEVAQDSTPSTLNLRLAIVADPLSQQGAELQSDAPACDVCGSITVRSGTCYKCLNCGNSMGCS